MDETLFEQTLKFSDANEEERDRIYSDIGFIKVNRVNVTGPKTAALKASGIDLNAFEVSMGKMTISEKIVHRRYSNLLIKKIPVEIYSDYENKAEGWINTCPATMLFYFFDDCVLSISTALIRDFVYGFLSDEAVSGDVTSMIETFIPADVQGKMIPGHNGIDVVIEPNGEAHRVLLFIDVKALEDTDRQITEYMFEDETEPEEEAQTEPIVS